MKNSKMFPSTLSLVLLAVYVQPGLQFSTAENEIPDDRSIVTINKYVKQISVKNIHSLSSEPPK